MRAFPMPDRSSRHLAPMPGRPWTIRAVTLMLMAAVLALPGTSSRAASEPAPSELKPAARQALERYTQLTDARNQDELKRSGNLLWIDTLPEQERTAAYAALRNSDVKMQKLQIRDAGKTIACPG